MLIYLAHSRQSVSFCSNTTSGTSAQLVIFPNEFTIRRLARSMRSGMEIQTNCVLRLTGRDGRSRRGQLPKVNCGCPMLKDDMKIAIDQHAYSIYGKPHRCKLQWAALEPRWASRAARYLLAIEVLPNGQATVPPTTVHVVTRASVTRGELLGLVEDALCAHLQTAANSSTEHPSDGTARESNRGSHNATTTTEYSL